MKRHLLALTCLLALLFSNHNTLASNPADWGKLSQYEIDLKEVPFLKSAHAVILNYYGEFRFVPGEDPRLTIHNRIKILDRDGLGAANVAIPYYADKGIEKIIGLKAQALLIRNGKVEKVRVPSEDIYKVDRGTFIKEVRFTFPGVQVGDVIEYSYDIVTKNHFSLWDVMFQHEYPALQTGLMALIDESIGVKIYYHGDRLSNKYGSKTTNYWTLKNVLPLGREPYTWNLKDYAEWVEFQLGEYYYHSKWTGIDLKTVEQSWAEVAKSLNKNSNFIGYTHKKYALNKMIEEAGVSELRGLAKARKLYEFVKDTYTWNNINAVYPESFMIVNDKKEGNTASLNMLLTALLQQAGFEAYPMLASTKYHGKVMPALSVMSQFNQTLAVLVFEDTYYILNAIDPLLAFGDLRKQDLNFKGFLVKKDKSEWIPITSRHRSKFTDMETVRISDGQVERQVSLMLEGSEARLIREKLIGEDHTEVMANYFELDVSSISNMQTEGLNDVEQPLKISFTYKTAAEQIKDMIILPPVEAHVFTENIFMSEYRYQPIDFAEGYTDKYIINIEIPEGYVVDHVPASERVVLAGNAGSLLFMSNQIGSRLQIQAALEFKRSFYLASEYPELRKMFETIVARFADNIVLKRAPATQQP